MKITKSLYEYSIYFIITLLYVAFLHPYYVKEYEVPDFFMYHFFSEQKLAAKDGFSSLFLMISRYSIKYYHIFQCATLGMMGVSFGLMTFLARHLKSIQAKGLYLLANLSLGSWYYFYGKIYYEFPFIALTYAIMLTLTANCLFPSTQKKNISISPKKLLLFFYLSGFCISWKPHAIFPVFGLYMLLLINNLQCYKIIFTKLGKFFLMCFFVFLLGYLTGNYNFLSSPTETLKGIHAYPATSNLLVHLFNDSRQSWDHISTVSFNTGVFNVWALLSIFFIAPLFLPKFFSAWLLNLLMCALYAVFIYNYSPGYLWHAFSISLYIPTIIFFLLSRYNNKLLTRKNTYFLGILSAAITIQLTNNFMCYLPEQITWFKNTDKAYFILKENAKLINTQIYQYGLSNREVGAVYKINIKVKRDTIDTHLNPLQSSDPIGWEKLMRQLPISTQSCHEIFVEPDGLYSIPFYISTEKVRHIKNFKQYRIGTLDNCTH